jgi:hypothetical protein
MCHGGIGASAQPSPRKMGVSADVAQGILGYLYCGSAFHSDSQTVAGGDSPPFPAA